jgi:hypothetical protein
MEDQNKPIIRRPRPIPKNHLKYIELCASGVPQEDAYRQCIGNPTTKETTVQCNASKYAKRYHHLIHLSHDKEKEIIQQAHEKKEAVNALNGVLALTAKILTQAQVDAVLCEIINGEIAGATAADRNRAIDIYNKRFGSNAAKLIDINTTTDMRVLVMNVVPKTERNI